MKNYDIKELRLSVGTSPDNYIMSKTKRFNTNGGFHRDADSVLSQRHSLVNEEENENEVNMVDDDILEYRVYRNNQYQLVETLERIDEGIGQWIADAAKAIPGLDQVVGDIELYMQAGEAKEIFDGLDKIFASLKSVSGLSAFSIVGTKEQYQKLLTNFTQADPEDKEELKSGIEKILEVLKQMTITAAQTFDSIVALPTFLAAGVGGIAGETIANIATSLGGFLRDLPIEKFIFETLSERSGIIAKIIDLFQSVRSLVLGGGTIGKALSWVVGKITSVGGEIVDMFFNNPFEILRRLGDLYRISIGENVENVEKNVNIDRDIKDVQAKINNIAIAEGRKKYSIKFLLESVSIEEEKEEETFKEIDLEEYSSVGGGSLGAVPVPPFQAPDKGKYKKALEEQIERMQILEAYHQKTSNRLK